MQESDKMGSLRRIGRHTGVEKRTVPKTPLEFAQLRSRYDELVCMQVTAVSARGYEGSLAAISADAPRSPGIHRGVGPSPPPREVCCIVRRSSNGL